MSRFHPPLPDFPPVPTAPMDPVAKRHLAEAILDCQKMISYKETQDHIQAGYARIWIHLTLERGLDPRKVSGVASKGHQDILKAFLAAGVRIGLHDRATLAWHAPYIAATATQLWRQAKESQGGLLVAPAGLGLQLQGGAR